MADTWIAFYGVKFDIPEDEDIALNDPEHPFIAQVVEAGLDWCDLPFLDRRNTDDLTVALMVGSELGRFGQEDMFSLSITDHTMQAVASNVKMRLQRLAIDQEPRLWLVFQPEDF
jgi:hypothetical protein